MNNPITGQTIESGNTDDYELIARIGSGRYGEVFEAFNVTNNKKCAIKVLKAVKVDKVFREINVLRHLQNGPNVIKLKDIIINKGIPSLVFSFISKQTLKSEAMNLNEYEIQLYLYKLLRAIDFAHKNNIIHRDIKPSNVVIDRSRKLLRLIDWGLADFHSSKKVYSVMVASRYYKSPELLLNYSQYDYSLDMWSFGCVVAELIFKRDHFFAGLDNADQLKVICCVLGTKCLEDYVMKYRIKANLCQYLIDCKLQSRNWKTFIVKGYESLVNDMAIDFIDKLLVFDHKHRLTSDEALRHPFFDGMKTKSLWL